MAAAQEKLLRLSSATFRHVSTGSIINLVSNDVRRFEDLSLTWPYLWAAPIEALVCTILIAQTVGWISAIAGEILAWIGFPTSNKLLHALQPILIAQ